MKKTHVLEGVLKMRFENICGKYEKRVLTSADAADLLGMSERTFRRKRARYEKNGLDGLTDRRLHGRFPKRAGDDEIAFITKLYNSHYRGFTVKHFHEFATAEYGLKYAILGQKTPWKSPI